MLVAGLDEAGRGPVIGPLVIGCVIWDENRLNLLEEMGIDDSKRLNSKRRLELGDLIQKKANYYQTLIIPAKNINEFYYKENLTLNQIEEIHFAKILNNLIEKPMKIYLDACDIIEERFARSIGKLLHFKPMKIISKHKGDAIFKIVGASSILAKIKRDEIIEGYHQKYGNCGSGYPSDPQTQKFLKNYFNTHQKFPRIVRTWWKTVQNIINQCKLEKTQKKITDY